MSDEGKMVSAERAREMEQQARHGASIMRDHERATGDEDRAEEYRTHAEDLDAAAMLARTVIALHAIIEGRATPPTDAEIAAHETAGGVFGFFCREEGYYTGSTVEEIRQPLPPGRWWAHAADGRPCAWPEVHP